MERMNLDLEIENVVIEINGEDFIINPDIPVATVKEIYRKQKDIGGDYDASTDFLIFSLKKYLYIENDSTKVDKLIDNLGNVKLSKLYKFVMNTISNVMESEVNDDKKKE